MVPHLTFLFVELDTVIIRNKSNDYFESLQYRQNVRFSTNKSLYLANDTCYRHSYYGRRIGTRMQSTKWYHFQ